MITAKTLSIFSLLEARLCPLMARYSAVWFHIFLRGCEIHVFIVFLKIHHFIGMHYILEVISVSANKCSFLMLVLFVRYDNYV